MQDEYQQEAIYGSVEVKDNNKSKLIEEVITEYIISIPKPSKLRFSVISRTTALPQRLIVRTQRVNVDTSYYSWIDAREMPVDQWMNFDTAPGIEDYDMRFHIQGQSFHLNTNGHWGWSRSQLRTLSTDGGEILHLAFDDYAGDGDFQDMFLKIWSR